MIEDKHEAVMVNLWSALSFVQSWFPRLAAADLAAMANAVSFHLGDDLQAHSWRASSSSSSRIIIIRIVNSCLRGQQA